MLSTCMLYCVLMFLLGTDDSQNQVKEYKQEVKQLKKQLRRSKQHEAALEKQLESKKLQEKEYVRQLIEFEDKLASLKLQLEQSQKREAELRVQLKNSSKAAKVEKSVAVKRKISDAEQATEADVSVKKLKSLLQHIEQRVDKLESTTSVSDPSGTLLLHHFHAFVCSQLMRQ